MMCGHFACIAFAFLVSFAAEAPAQTVEPTGDAMTRYRIMTSVAPKRCTADPDPAVITVCATKLRETQKVPYIEELRAGDRPRLVLGELPGQYVPPCPVRGCPCPPTECGIRALAKKIFGGD